MFRRLATIALLICTSLYYSAFALAQDEDAAPKPAKRAGKPAKEPAKITDPAVLAILESKPASPAELLEAARMLGELGYADLAKGFLKQLIGDKLDDEALARLVEKFGTPVFMRFAKIESLAPEAGQFADSALAAADKLQRNPQRLKQLVNQLSDADVTRRQDAMVGLIRAGSFAVAPLFMAYVDPAHEREAGTLREMLLRLKQDAVGPLIAIVHDGNLAQASAASDLLSRLGAVDALPAMVELRFGRHPDGADLSLLDAALTWLNGRVPTPQSASNFLERETRRQLQAAKLIDSRDNYGAVAPTEEIWHWNGETGEAVRSNEPASSVARQRAYRAASALRSIAVDRMPAEQKSVEDLYLLAWLEDAMHRGALEKVDVIPCDAATLAALLPTALNGGYDAAAVGALQLIGKHGSPELLLASGGRWSPLTEAARNGDRRVRFAAIQAILNLKPIAPFAGASAVSEGLQFYAAATGRPRAVVAHPKSLVAQQLAGYLSPLGYEVEIATNGREAFRLATQSPDIEFAIIHSAIDHPRADDLLTQLRKDPRTAQLPVAIIAVPDFTDPAERLARGVPYTHAFAEPQDAAALKYQVERLLSMPGCAPVPAGIRHGQASFAITALDHYAEHPVQWLDARGISRSIERSLYSPSMTGAVASLLASAGTATGQNELVQLAGRDSLPLAKREAAALAFARSVAGHGILLTTDQILHQYDRYNDNAGRNKDTHKVMQIILDAIESKSEISSRPPAKP